MSGCREMVEAAVVVDPCAVVVEISPPGFLERRIRQRCSRPARAACFRPVLLLPPAAAFRQRGGRETQTCCCCLTNDSELRVGRLGVIAGLGVTGDFRCKPRPLCRQVHGRHVVAMWHGGSLNIVIQRPPAERRK